MLLGQLLAERFHLRAQQLQLALLATLHHLTVLRLQRQLLLFDAHTHLVLVTLLLHAVQRALQLFHLLALTLDLIAQLLALRLERRHLIILHLSRLQQLRLQTLRHA